MHNRALHLSTLALYPSAFDSADSSSPMSRQFRHLSQGCIKTWSSRKCEALPKYKFFACTLNIYLNTRLQAECWPLIQCCDPAHNLVVPHAAYSCNLASDTNLCPPPPPSLLPPPPALPCIACGVPLLPKSCRQKLLVCAVTYLLSVLLNWTPPPPLPPPPPPPPTAPHFYFLCFSHGLSSTSG